MRSKPQRDLQKEINEQHERHGNDRERHRTRREIRTQSATTQNFFFDGRLVTTFGLRKDKIRSRDSNGATIDPATGLLNYDALKVWQRWIEKSGDTKTAGAVVKPSSNATTRSVPTAASNSPG